MNNVFLEEVGREEGKTDERDCSKWAAFEPVCKYTGRMGRTLNLEI